MYSLIYFLSETYYVPLVLLALSIVTAIIGYFNRQKFKYLRLFPVYALVSAIQILISLACVFFRIPTFRHIINYSVLIFVIIEFFVFYNFLFQVIKNKHFKRSMQIMQTASISFGLYICLDFPDSNTIPLSFNIVNSTLLFIPCLFFFYEVFKTPPSTSLANQPSFWIIIGFAFMIICTLPFNLLETYFLINMTDLYNQICTLSYVFYCLIFFLICKAFLCKPIITK
jgi:hypothetical protein